jgi:succinyl-CoA synthetase beta subunit
VLDRSTEKLAIIASTEGGMEIEEVAERSPEKILEVELNAEEQKMFDASVQHVRTLVEQIKL